MKSKIFKIISMILFILIILSLLNGCNLDKSDDLETTIDTKVIENDLYNKQLIVAGIYNSSFSQIWDKCVISCKDIKSFSKSGEEIFQDKIMVGDIATIMYDGYIKETYPTKITNLKRIEIR